jgi:uncharacterized protein
MNERFPQLFWGLVALTIGLVCFGYFTASAIKEAKRSNDAITVTGSARKTIRSDYATWAFSVGFLHEQMKPSYDRLIGRSGVIKSFISDLHLPDSSVTVLPVRSDQIFHSRTGEFLGYHCTQRFEIRTSLVDSVAAWNERLSGLIPVIVDMSPEAPQYFFTRLSELRMDMLSEATTDAKLRAERIASSAGGKVTTIRNARMGVFQITAPNSREVRDYGIYDTGTINKDITAVVTVTFAVE